MIILYLNWHSVSQAKHYLQSVAMKPAPGVIALEDVTTIFYKMDDFHHIHKSFVDELEAKLKNWSDDQQIAEAVKQLVKVLTEFDLKKGGPGINLARDFLVTLNDFNVFLQYVSFSVFN